MSILGKKIITRPTLQLTSQYIASLMSEDENMQW